MQHKEFAPVFGPNSLIAMTKLYLLLAFCLLSCTLIAAPNSSPHQDRELTVGQWLDMNVKEYQAHTGSRLSFKEKLGYAVVKKKVKSAVRKNLIPAEHPAEDILDDFEFNLGAFLLSMFFPILGFVAVVLFFDDRDAWQSAVLGSIVGLLLGVAIFL